jgi:alpha-glucosidase
LNGGWPCWAISNHDVERVVTRWGGPTPPAHLAAQLIALVSSLRGSVCMYQGEELGLTEAQVPFEALRDPYGLAFWPNFAGRDGCRTPLPWDDGPHAGFSSTQPWLPIPSEHRELCVARQIADRRSTLNNVRAFLRWRKAHPALAHGSIRFMPAPEPLLALVRGEGADEVLAIFNLSNEPCDFTARELTRYRQIETAGVHEGRLDAARAHIPGHGVVFAAV